MYHAFISPTFIWTPTDQITKASIRTFIDSAHGFTNYTTFSLWDTYRALHPFFNIIQPTRNRDMVRSMMAHYDQSVQHMLPVWSHYANENWCMIGYHSVSVIADAIVTGNLTGAEANRALERRSKPHRRNITTGSNIT